MAQTHPIAGQMNSSVRLSASAGGRSIHWSRFVRPALMVAAASLLVAAPFVV